MSIRKKFTTAVAAAALAGALLIAVPTSAQAALTCSGTRIDTLVVKNASGTVVGRTGVYKSGTNICAVLVKAGPLYGRSSYTSLDIMGYRGWGEKRDAGSFRYQTDALTLNAAKSSNRCVYVYTQMKSASGAKTFSARTGVYCV